MKAQDNLMTESIPTETFRSILMDLLDETFDNTHGIYLDRDTSLFRTLATVSAQEASIPVGGKCASLAAQVTHVIFYLEVLDRYIVQHDSSRVDWGEIWRTVEKITPEEWDALRLKLEATYRRVEKLFRETQDWNEDALGGALGVVVHSAYHLGEIRQALCTLK